MSTSEQLLKLDLSDLEGGGHLKKQAITLLIVACIAYDMEYYEEPATRRKCSDIVGQLLSAARTGGYTQSDILHTLLVKGETSQRVIDMATAACNAAGSQNFLILFSDIPAILKESIYADDRQHRACTNCAHHICPTAPGKPPHCVNLIPIEDGDVLRCYEHHQTLEEDAADTAAHIAARAAISKAKVRP